jgi:predicted Zn-dependent protease
VITDLAQISALRVISPASLMVYKGARKPLPQIARELNVDAVVEGTVVRAGDRVRIPAQLIEASTDKHLCSQSMKAICATRYPSKKKVAKAIADQIRINLTPLEKAALKNVKVVNPEAYEPYLKGRYFWNKRTADGLRAALTYFKQAMEQDPKYAQAYSGLADTYALLGVRSDDSQGSVPQSEGGGDQSSGIGQLARRSPQLACIRLGWFRLGF